MVALRIAMSTPQPSVRALFIAVVWSASFLALLPRARAHGSSSAQVLLQSPVGAGTVVDRVFEITWLDFDRAIATGTATIDLYFVPRAPPTFRADEIPRDLVGTPIAMGIREADPQNRFTWDTSLIPAGSYVLWAKLNEPPSEQLPDTASLSGGVLTIAHPGDVVHPAVFVRTPDAPTVYAHERYLIRYSAFDPDGTGKVVLRAGQSRDPDALAVIAEDLPATQDGAFDWPLLDVRRGDWTIEATITDARGLSYTHYARHFLLVFHPPGPDAGLADDAGVNTPDGGFAPPVEPGCGCRAGHPRGPDTFGRWGVAWMAIALVKALRSGARNAARPRVRRRC